MFVFTFSFLTHFRQETLCLEGFIVFFYVQNFRVLSCFFEPGFTVVLNFLYYYENIKNCANLSTKLSSILPLLSYEVVYLFLSKPSKYFLHKSFLNKIVLENLSLLFLLWSQSRILYELFLFFLHFVSDDSEPQSLRF